ncbi:MAG: DNA mismatch repair protein MutS [Deltaproteobacteria bacterium]|nr:DNA mismatch repair protein MutS [Deltaproteobacteria bacterium]
MQEIEAKPSVNLTPMLRQYLELKQQHQDAILFFRMGDFYEMFFEDAHKASAILEIALTSRNKGDENAVPMCGVPYHAASSYIARLVQAGLKVAICEQMEDPSSAKGIVRREVVRVISPGLVLEAESLDARGNNYLASLSFHQDQIGFSFVDISTGEMGVAYFQTLEALQSELPLRAPKEIIVALQDLEHPFLKNLKNILPHCVLQTYAAELDSSKIINQFSDEFQKCWKALGLEQVSPLAQRAALRLLAYIQEALKSSVNHLHEIHWVKEQGHLVLDATTVRSLELVRNLQEGGTWGTLFQVLDNTKTSMGARKLKSWILYPLNSIAAILQRQQAIAELLENSFLSEPLSGLLAQVIDLERQNSRMATGIANARDVYAVGKSLELLPQIQENISHFHSAFFQGLLADWENLKDLSSNILNLLREDAPLTLREGGLIRDGVHAELDELRAIERDGKGHLAKMEEEEKQRSGISSLKIRYNRVFGYYIEISNTKRDQVPARYIRKQTLVNAERYITPELKSYEEKVLGAEGRIRVLEYELFSQLRTQLATQASKVSKMARKIAEMDALLSLSAVAKENNYCCPDFVSSEELNIIEGRHPVLEKLFPSNRFVPNDVLLNGDTCRLMLITGPNMAGKSTILRQTAVIAMLAHMGSYVPARSCRLSLLDRIFTRIGASDNLSKNQSTFWVEMEETAHILATATSKSLIILDEIGRGTSTYDGLSVAWSVAEYLHDVVKAKALFATHYHELIQLADEKKALQNFHIAVKEWKGEILFLYQLVPGGTSQSYGVKVASLAGIPKKVIGRAEEILKQLSEKNPPQPTPASESLQMPLFTREENPLIKEIENLQIDHLTPLEALQILYAFQKKIRGL